MRNTFIETLCEIAEQNNKIWLLCGDLGYSVLEDFEKRFSARFVNVGVAEQNMIGVAAGLALSGKTVFVYSIANFPVMRCFEQLRNDVCYHNLDIKIVAVGGGFVYGSAGYTHHGLEDLAVMRVLPNMTVVAPGDPIEVKFATRAITDLTGPCYLRLGRGGEPVLHDTIPNFGFKLGKAVWVQRGKDVALISTGGILEEVLKAAKKLESQGIGVSVISMHTINPLDFETLREVVGTVKCIITVEEHSAKGGLGGAVAEGLSELSVSKLLVRIGIQGVLSKSGSHVFMRKLQGLDSDHIAAVAIDIFKKLF